MGVVLTLDGKQIDTPRVRAGHPVVVRCRAEQLTPVLDLTRKPIDRCLASKSLPLDVLRLFYGRSTVLNMRAVARKLCPVLVKRAQETEGISLRLLVFAAYGRTPEEQIARWNDYVLRASEDRSADHNHAQRNPQSE